MKTCFQKIISVWILLDPKIFHKNSCDGFQVKRIPFFLSKSIQFDNREWLDHCEVWFIIRFTSKQMLASVSDNISPILKRIWIEMHGDTLRYVLGVVHARKLLHRYPIKELYSWNLNWLFRIEYFSIHFFVVVVVCFK